MKPVARRGTIKALARRAYALMLVLVFIVLFLAMLGVAWRQMASVLRIEAVRSNQMRRDQGSLLAAIEGIHYLEQNPSATLPHTLTPTIDGRAYTVTIETDIIDSEARKITAVPTP
jgi:hypothetical protein